VTNARTAEEGSFNIIVVPTKFHQYRNDVQGFIFSGGLFHDCTARANLIQMGGIRSILEQFSQP
jgi:hypothetical protein